MQKHIVSEGRISMPREIMGSAQWKALPASARVVFQTMLLKCSVGLGISEQCLTWLQDELADEAGLSLRTVKSCLKQLVAQGWLEIVKAGSRWSKGTVYRLSWPRTQEEKGSEQRRRPKRSHLYLYILEIDGFHKIGTTRRPKQRIKKYVTENPYPVSILLMVSVSSPSIENMCREMLSEKHYRGEWYRLDESDLAQVKTLATRT